jgi:hypothetical protein
MLSVRFAAVLLLATVVMAQNTSHKKHPDYVPDQKTAELIAKAVLVAHYGDEIVNSQSPLLVDGSNKDYWIVQVSARENGMPKISAQPAVWINKNSGCIDVMGRMK